MSYPQLDLAADLVEMLGTIIFLYTIATYLQQLRPSATTASRRTPPQPGGRAAGTASPKVVTGRR